MIVAYANGLPAVFVGIGLWGVHMALTQGILARLVADTAPTRLIGSAFGMFNLMTGVALLLASVAGGLLWDTIGPRATFLAAASFAGASGLMMILTQFGRPIINR